MKAKLTLTIDKDLIHQIKQKSLRDSYHAGKQISVSQMFEWAIIDLIKKDTTPQLNPARCCPSPEAKRRKEK